METRNGQNPQRDRELTSSVALLKLKESIMNNPGSLQDLWDQGADEPSSTERSAAGRCRLNIWTVLEIALAVRILLPVSA
jgi:hypothetical protein